MKRGLFIILWLCSAAFGQHLWTNVLDPSRAIDWTNAGATISTTRTQCGSTGDYRTLSNSPAVNLFPAGSQVLPYDLNGVLRDNRGLGAAGAYEQTALPQVFLTF